MESEVKIKSIKNLCDYIKQMNLERMCIHTATAIFSTPLSFRVEPETDTGIYLHIERTISQSETGRRKLRGFKVKVVDSVHATTQLLF